MASTTAGPTHRERLRALTLAEIKDQAYAQIAEGGTGALTLSAIARAMGMSGPALYRYFASREELMATLVTESFEDLADTLDAVAEEVRAESPQDRLRAVANGFRSWALGAPHRYRLVFASPYGTGALDPARIVPAATRSMTVILAALNALEGSRASKVRDRVLGHELVEWGKRQGSDTQYDEAVLQLGLAAWTRLHGIISLEVEGFFGQVGVDPARIFDGEVDHLIFQCVSGQL
jgi:AcrR family transcriptional regulator